MKQQLYDVQLYTVVQTKETWEVEQRQGGGRITDGHNSMGTTDTTNSKRCAQHKKELLHAYCLPLLMQQLHCNVENQSKPASGVANGHAPMSGMMWPHLWRASHSSGAAL